MTTKKKRKAAGQATKPVSKASGSATKSTKKQRGGLLSVLIGLIFLHSVIAVYLGYITLKDEYASYRTWVVVGLSLLSLLDILAAVGMWYWKKWAIYLYAVTRVLATSIHLMLTGSLLVVFYDLLPVAILGYVINLQTKRQFFE